MNSLVPNEFLLRATYFPHHADNRMHGEGDVAKARAIFLQQRFNNLAYLLRQRYDWMKDYIRPGDNAVELGAGTGLLKEFLPYDNITLTDVEPHPWIDRVVDATRPDFDEASVDVIICSHMIHHLASPIKFFDKIHTSLKEGGYVLIQEINTSLMMRALLRLMRHEGWSYDVDVFDPTVVCNDPTDPWSANCAIPELLFGNTELFDRKVTGFRIVKKQMQEGFIFPLSGGVISKTRMVELPDLVLRNVEMLDRLLIRLFPATFALGLSVVLQKTSRDGR